jgi:sec-independent protein translocase protein TatC
VEDAKLTLLEHLSELRSRLWRVVIAILLLGGASLYWAREIFGFLMRPVLGALPEGSRSLVYTSGVEEINVLLKVGLYAGLFLATPIALYQLWLFVAPGLLKTERRWVGPFVSFGSIFFLAGALFCYFAVLPSMFQFLLKSGETRPVRERIAQATAKADGASRLLFLGDAVRAAELAASAQTTLSSEGEGRVPPPAVLVHRPGELEERMARLGRLLDEAIASSAISSSDPRALARAVILHQEAETLTTKRSFQEAATKLDEAAAGLSEAFGDHAGAFQAIWSAQRHLAGASRRMAEEEWTRPMLSMREQLSLVLVLEVAFGLIFELPLVMALLSMAGLLRFRWVARYQRHAILACFVVAAVVTPTGDVVNLSLMAIPMVVCYELGVLLVWIFERRRKASAPDGLAAG